MLLVVLVFASSSLVACDPQVPGPTREMIETVSHFVTDESPKKNSNPLGGGETALLNIGLLEDVSYKEEPYILAKIASIGNELCLMNESHCYRDLSPRWGYFDATIFHVPEEFQKSIANDFREEWIAESVEEVATIIWFEYELNRVGTYEPSGQLAIQHSVKVSIIDIKRGVMLANKTFLGGMPTDTISPSFGSSFGTLPPVEEIGAWLASASWRRK